MVIIVKLIKKIKINWICKIKHVDIGGCKSNLHGNSGNSQGRWMEKVKFVTAVKGNVTVLSSSV